MAQNGGEHSQQQSHHNGTDAEACQRIPLQLTEDEQKYIIGMQGNLWTEHVATFDHAMYMFLPRTSAIAEASWSHNNKDFERYTTNLNNLVKFYEAYGYNYAKSYWREGK